MYPGYFLTSKCVRSLGGDSVHFWFSTSCISKTDSRTAKITKMGDSVAIFSVYKLLFTVSIQSRSGVFRCNCDFPQSYMYISNATGPRTKWTKIWGLWGQYLIFTGYFWQQIVQSYSEFIQLIYNFQKLCMSKTASRTADWHVRPLRIWNSYMGYLWPCSAQHH